MTAPSNCSSPGCCGGLSRRETLKVIGLSAASALAVRWPVMAGPFEVADFEKLVPADKRLDPAWVKSLFERGSREVWRGADLEKIGMPVGGICAGQLYLGGDGKLWHWDIFNQHIETRHDHYAKPMEARSPLEQGFTLKITTGDGTQVRTLDRTGFAGISFTGEYPIAFIEYRDATVPVTVSLEAFSPFIPLNADDSALPATVMQFTIENTGNEKVEAELAGWLENAVCLNSAAPGDGSRRNRLQRGEQATFIESSAVAAPHGNDIVFEDFEKPAYEGWMVTGTAFGSGPVEKKKLPPYQGEVGGAGQRVANSHGSAPGNNPVERERATGRLTSRDFKIERRFILFYIGGGNHTVTTCLNLVVDGKIVRTMTGRNSNLMTRESFDVREFAGKIARLEIVDDQQDSWANIGVDQIVFTDDATQAGPLKKRADFGTMALACLGEAAAIVALPAGNLAEEIFPGASAGDTEAARPFGQKLVGALKRKVSLEPGQSATVTFVIAWHFPNQKLRPVKTSAGRRYATRFANAAAVVEHLAQNFDALAGQTRLWHATWYDSTLPFWLLNRTMLNTSILASSTCHWFADGRFYGWEGVGCCQGTCTHVWHYAQAVARLFPQLERDLRERTDFGLAFHPETGLVNYRGEHIGIAIDGQAGVILRSYREHRMSPSEAFLKRNWPKIRKALEFLLSEDTGASGILEGAQRNGLDMIWHGPVPWLSSLYLAALRAGQEMAREAGDDAFAQQCGRIWEQGRANFLELFNGEYFISKPDPQHADEINPGSGCEIDQVLGQSWAWQAGLGRVLPETETLAALKALWRYNFSPDVGPWREANKPGRWFAMAGEAGLLMCTFPRLDWSYLQAAGKKSEWGPVSYFNECMNGFEYQVASHMIWEGMVQEGLAITRAVHDRYHPSRRNPWNEIECGDHYARSMASYGVFLAACGFEYHGAQGHIAFAPRLTPENFKAAFTVAEGWGAFSQKLENGSQKAKIELKSGTLRLKSLSLAPLKGAGRESVKVTLGSKSLAASLINKDGKLLVRLADEQTLIAGQALEWEIR